MSKEYADWTFEEFKDIFLGTRYDLSTNKQGSSGRFLRMPPHVQIPDRIDWRDLGAVTEVKNQGKLRLKSFVYIKSIKIKFKYRSMRFMLGFFVNWIIGSCSL